MRVCKRCEFIHKRLFTYYAFSVLVVELVLRQYGVCVWVYYTGRLAARQRSPLDTNVDMYIQIERECHA